jgi:GMP synthase (glutamine-hydrolysing)
MMHRWMARGHDRLEMPGARPRHTHLTDRAVYDFSGRAWLGIFLKRWLGG